MLLWQLITHAILLCMSHFHLYYEAEGEERCPGCELITTCTLPSAHILHSALITAKYVSKLTKSWLLLSCLFILYQSFLSPLTRLQSALLSDSEKPVARKRLKTELPCAYRDTEKWAHLFMLICSFSLLYISSTAGKTTGELRKKGHWHNKFVVFSVLQRGELIFLSKSFMCC